MLVLAAILAWRAPRHSRDVLLLMDFLNGLWALTDLVYIPLVHLTDLDFYAKAGRQHRPAPSAWRVAARRPGAL